MITILLGCATLIMAGPLNWLREFDEVGSCVDIYPTECKEHAAAEGYCEDYRDFMETRCARTCGFCQPQVPVGPGVNCRDEIERCAEHAAIKDYCEYNSDFMSRYCRKSCQYCRQPIGPAKDFFWEKLPWGVCEQGVEGRGVRCIHIYEGREYRVDLQACRENLTNEPEPVDKRVCAK